MKVHCNLPRTVGRTCQRTEAATGADRSDQACRSEYRRRIAHHRLPRRRGGAISDPSRFALSRLVRLCCECHCWVESRPSRSSTAFIDQMRGSTDGCLSATTRLNGFAFGRVDTELEAAAPGRTFVIRKCLRRRWVPPDRCRISTCRYSDNRSTSKCRCVMVAYYA